MALSKRYVCQRLPALLLALVLLTTLLLPVQVSAEENRVFTGSIELTTELAERFYLNTSDEDLFNLKNIIPGDSWEGEIHVKNKCKKTMEISIISIVNDLEDDYLFDLLDLEISIDGDEIYSGSYGETEEPVSEWYPVKPGRTITFDVKVKLPEKIGNGAQGKTMDSTWTFEARMLENAGTGPSKDKIPYYVYYVDEDGNELLDTKEGYGNEGATITEHAEDIPGYVPDAESKSIILTKKNNEIIFVYKKTDETDPVVPVDPVDPTPTDPVDPVDPEPQPDDPDNIKTGDDMTEGNSGSAIWLILLLACAFAGFVTYLRIRQAKKETASKEVSTK